jgi:hypothetical protein
MSLVSLRKPLTALALAALGLPALVQADCVPTAPVGYSVPFRLVSLENLRGNSTLPASYVDGVLGYTAHNEFFRGTTLSSTDNQQLLSNRTYCRQSSGGSGIHLCDDYQPFDVDQAGSENVSISDGENLLVPVISGGGDKITVTLNKGSYTATCDATSEELYFSTSDGMYVIAFGTPQAPLPQPK